MKKRKSYLAEDLKSDLKKELRRGDSSSIVLSGDDVDVSEKKVVSTT